MHTVRRLTCVALAGVMAAGLSVVALLAASPASSAGAATAPPQMQLQVCVGAGIGFPDCYKVLSLPASTEGLQTNLSDGVVVLCPLLPNLDNLSSLNALAGAGCIADPGNADYRVYAGVYPEYITIDVVGDSCEVSVVPAVGSGLNGPGGVSVEVKVALANGADFYCRV